MRGMSPPPDTRIPRKVVIAACFGVFLEWYDFLTFASLATYFSILFFPSNDPVAGLLASLATFGIGMLVRPLGSALFGSLADRYGRRPVFIATISLMGLATFCVGLLPTYAQVGLWASALLLLCRLLQGLAAGGEIGGSAVYLTEHAPAGRRGVYTSVLQLMAPLGLLVCTVQVLLLQDWLGNEVFSDWGWRVPFLFSLALTAIALISRIHLQESPVFQHLHGGEALSDAPLRECLRDRRTLGRMALLFCCVSAGGSLLFFSSQVYTGIYLQNVVRLDTHLVWTLITASTLLLFPLTILCGWLSDRVGRRPVILAGLLLGAISIVPVYDKMMHYGNPALERFNREVPVALHGNNCAYSPFVAPRNDCERTQELLIKLGATYELHPALPDGLPRLFIGDKTTVTGFRPSDIASALHTAGWPEQANTQESDQVMLFLLLAILVAAVALVTGPQTAVLAELFSARTRYTAAALPHNLSAGWIGGMSPFMVTLLNVKAGNSVAGLWYPAAALGVALVLGVLFLPETKDVKLEE
jgi:MFS family permease